jgi:calmodulin
MVESLNVEEMQEFKEIFDIYASKDLKCVDLADFDKLLRNMGRFLDNEDMQELILEIDKEGNGTMEYEGFLKVLSKFSRVFQAEKEIIDFCEKLYKGDEACVNVEDMEYAIKLVSEGLNDKEKKLLLRHC